MPPQPHAYYNEIDPYAAQWLRNLIAAGHIAPGDVDERSIADVRADDLTGYTQCHFFAGIGGWSLALRLAGWPDARPVWTGSCPCQPFSVAGKQKGTADERHLWPEFRRLITDRAPATVFGEQVAAKAGRDWLAGVRSDLEGLGYAVGAADLCAAGISAPHIRQRLWFVGDAAQHQWYGRRNSWKGRRGEPSDASGWRTEPQRLDNAASPRRDGPITEPEGEARDETRLRLPGARSFWSAHDLIPCRDGKARRVEPGTFPLAHGIPARVAKLRAFGNAIVPQVAAEFIAAYMDAA